MPKRYRVVGGSGFTWEYIDEDTSPWTLLAESHDRWNTEQEVEDEINAMGGNRGIVRGRDGKKKPAPKHPPKKTGT